MKKEHLSYCLIRTITYPIALLPYSVLHWLGRFFGLLAFYSLKKFRQRTLSNLALAKDLHLSEKELFKTAQKVFQNLAINILEYPKFAYEKNFSKRIICQNPEKAFELYKQKRGIIFFCGHQANWEALFLDGNLRMEGVAIGKPFRNKQLYHWVQTIREKTGGKMIPPDRALREGIKSLKEGKFLGIVGDQGMPESNYSFPFFGRRAFTSTAPALLAYKTNSPIMVATTVRKKGKYYIRYSDPLFPNLEEPLEKEVFRLMDASLTLLQASIHEHPDQWLWQHNRYKQQTLKTLYRAYRFECLGILLPEEKEPFERMIAHLPTLKKIYEKAFLILFIPEKYKHLNPIEVEELIPYQNWKELLKPEYRSKLIFNFTNHRELSKHFAKFSALSILTLSDLKRIASQHFPNQTFSEENLSEIFLAALTRPKTGALLETLKKTQTVPAVLPTAKPPV